MRRPLIALFLACIALPVGACTPPDAPARNEIAQAQAGGVAVVLLSSGDALPKDRGAFTLEFRSQADNQLTDVGDVTVSATMPMAGMAPMFGTVTARRTDIPGRYDVESDLGMVGSWRIGVEWKSGDGTASVVLSGRVQ